ncbi:hypothetical protein OsJ_26730 [Oryza sativa Japonica Group]|uniref:Uncharacterized protein n=2 Tax=Oryza TaxID=4527 RepID=Q6ZIY6_ORYSJ|nr:hypothetical protein OsJ_26730 [Oryza sativa Japonica Group]BAC99414.1 hypothetical protein [Oryza sativa Japonica Group]
MPHEHVTTSAGSFRAVFDLGLVRQGLHPTRSSNSSSTTAARIESYQEQQQQFNNSSSNAS